VLDCVPERSGGTVKWETQSTQWPRKDCPVRRGFVSTSFSRRRNLENFRREFRVFWQRLGHPGLVLVVCIVAVQDFLP
jgi:hypothetical protein